MKRQDLSELSQSNWGLLAVGAVAVVAIGVGLGLAAPTTEPTTMPASSNLSPAELRMQAARQAELQAIQSGSPTTKSSQLAGAASQPATTRPAVVRTTPTYNGGAANGAPYGGAAGGGRQRGGQGGAGGGPGFAGGGRGGRGGGPGGPGGRGGSPIASSINQDPFPDIVIPPTRAMSADYLAMTSRNVFLQGQPRVNSNIGQGYARVSPPEEHFVFNGVTTTYGVVEAQIMDNSTGKLYSVRIGDPICSGKVTAITDNHQITYLANGRSVIIAMGSTLAGTSSYDTVQPTYVAPTAPGVLSAAEQRMQANRQKELQAINGATPAAGQTDGAADNSAADNSGADDSANQ